MFSKLGIKIDDIVECSERKSFDSSLLIKLLNEFCQNLQLIPIKEIEYGRYLAYKSEKCNIQVDIFSQNYKGQIHNHNSWGAIAIVNGNFLLKDYVQINKDLTEIRKTFSSKGHVSYFSSFSDIHSLESQKGEQGVTIHVYGSSFDMDYGKRFNLSSLAWENYKRSSLKEFKEIKSYFTLKEK